MMKKIIGAAVLFLMLAVVFVLTGCNAEYKQYTGLGTHEGLDAKTELELIKYYSDYTFNGQESIDNWCFDPFYGVYDGYVIFGMGESLAFRPQTYKLIDGLSFLSPEMGTRVGIYAWKSGEEYWLSELYELGKISRKSLETIHARYKKIHRYWYGDFGEHEDLVGLGTHEGLDAETELKIIKMVYGNNYKGQETVDAWSFRNYYGVYGGYVFYYLSAWGTGGKYRNTIDGLLLVTEETVCAWKDGKAYYMEELYNEGQLTRADLEKFQEYCKKRYAQYYGDEEKEE